MSDGLADLLARVEAAEGASGELDRDIALAMGWTRQLDPEVYMPHHPAPWAWTDPEGYYEGDRDGEVGPHRFTASLDASLALVERVLPGMTWDIGSDENGLGRFYTAMLWTADYKRDTGEQTAKTPALALLAALLKALIAQEQAPA